MNYSNRFLPLLSLIALLLGAPVANAQDALRGKALYLNTNGAPLSCGNAACHGVDPTRDMNSVLKGRNRRAGNPGRDRQRAADEFSVGLCQQPECA